MKKFGFTLAEVLITLGVIGVVSALTIPALINNTTESQIGPKLAKAASAFEQANKSLLANEEVDSLTDARVLDTVDGYFDELSKYLKVSEARSDWYATKEGIVYNVTTVELDSETLDSPADQQKIGIVGICLDSTILEGNLKPGYNTFYFSWWNDGSLRPVGGTNWNGLETSAKGAAEHWMTKCPVGKFPASNNDYQYCTGHIFENNLKVLYK